jgi:enamine deaminase RidA (YjgF/YER057c/UK114 family)
MTIEHLKPEGLHHNPAFTQVIALQAPAKLLFVGGQNAVDASGAIVGDELGTQTEQALRNVLTALAAGGATQANVVKLSVHVVQGAPVSEAFAAAQRVWGRYPTAITVLVVAGLANPRFLVEVDAIAAL